MNVSCQCRALTFRTSLPSPLAVYICHCTECQRQSSSAFGCSAIFPAFSLPPKSTAFPLSMYSRPTSTGHVLDCFFCSTCGTRVMHAVRGDERRVVSVKGGCIEGLDWSQARHIWTRNALVPIPEGVERWEEEPSSDSVEEEMERVLDKKGQNGETVTTMRLLHEQQYGTGKPWTGLRGAGV